MIYSNWLKNDEGANAMKLSKYNFFYPIDETGNYLAFNALKNGLATFPGALVEILQTLQPGETLDLPDTVLADLKKGGFVCDDNFDEYGLLLIRRHLQQYFSNNSLGITVAPTIFCNLSCRYCFESPQNLRMDATVMAQMVEFVQKKVDEGLKTLSVNWFGGEPLLCMDIIEELSEKWLAICQQKDVKYTAYIITNGTLYTPAVATRLKELKVTGAQITLDGDKEHHDVRRPYRGGQGSFEKIFTNILDTAGILPISLRVNVDRQNVDGVLDFYKSVHGHPRLEPHFQNGDIKVHYGHVRKYSASCRCSAEECLKDTEFWLEEFKLNQYLSEKGMIPMTYPSINSGCTATSINGYLVGPAGELYKCWNHIGEKEKVIGHIDKPIAMDAMHISYLTESFENDEACRFCPVLPICMGGCVDLRIGFKNGTFPTKDCSRFKYYLEESIKAFYMAKLKKAAAPN